MKTNIGPVVLRAVVAASLAAIMCGGCGGPVQPKTLRLEAAQDGTSVTLATGDRLEVALESNPSTGYTWVVASVDREVLEPTADEMEQAADGAVVGAPGTQVLSFEGVGAGETALELEYRRSWETTAAPERTFSVRATVE